MAQITDIPIDADDDPPLGVCLVNVSRVPTLVAMLAAEKPDEVKPPEAPSAPPRSAFERLAPATPRLEEIRQKQERAWFRAGYSRDEIIHMFRNWPMDCGYQPYTWAVGLPPTDHHVWR